MTEIQFTLPSGETETYRLTASERPLRIGKSEGADIRLRDPLAPDIEISLLSNARRASAEIWIRCAPTGEVSVGGVKAREIQLQPGLPVRLGDTQIVAASRSDSPGLPSFPGGVRPWKTASERGRELLWQSKRAAQTGLSVYLAGETGTGKEVLASLIHAWSPRARGPFVPLHCGALPINLAESELFGHVRGAFTGAERSRMGAFLQAHGGTLFLDEVGDLSPEIQVKLLRFLENGEIRPVGSDQVSHADVRLLCATHHPLERLVEEGRFRRDLYYRLASVTLRLPELRHRPEDIDLLARDFAASQGKVVSKDALRMLQAHSWPGNVRELRHGVERAAGMVEQGRTLLTQEDFRFLEDSGTAESKPALQTLASLNLKEAERALLLRALKAAAGNRTEAAKLLGVARSTLFEMLKRHGIQGPKMVRVPAEILVA